MLTCGGIGVLRFEKFGAHRYRFEKLELNDFEFWKKNNVIKYYSYSYIKQFTFHTSFRYINR